MKNFFRKVAFGIGPNEEVPSDPLAWALNQLDDVPDLTWKGRIPSSKEMIEKHARKNLIERKKLQKKYKDDKKLLKIVDVLGRETKVKKNTLLFYTYSDGTVEKRIIIY